MLNLERKVWKCSCLDDNRDKWRRLPRGVGYSRGIKEDKTSWVAFFKWLKGRGLDGVKLVVSGKNAWGMLKAVEEAYPEAKYQRCTIHFYRNIFSVVPRSKVKHVAKMLKAIYAQENKKAREKTKALLRSLEVWSIWRRWRPTKRWQASRQPTRRQEQAKWIPPPFTPTPCLL